MKKNPIFSKLMSYAGSHRFLTYASWFFAAISALVAFIPFIYIWKIIQEILRIQPNFSMAENLTHYGWSAFGFAVLAMLFYFASLMCSHTAAFRVATNIRLDLTHQILKMPLGFTDTFGSGNLRKIVTESSSATETYLAHNLPDRVVAITTFLSLFILLLFFDWRLGLMSLLPTALSFIPMSLMTGKRTETGLREYSNALANMSNEAVEYVRGIAVVKTFGQTIFSFKKFKESIDNYQKWVIAYTKSFSLPMVVYTTIVNSVFAFLIIAAMLITKNTVTSEFVVNFMFYLIITPIISITLSKIMFQSQNKLIVADALNRIDSVMQVEPLQEPSISQVPKDHSLALENISYSYDGEVNAVSDVSFKIQPKQTAALVGPSGSGKSTIANLITRFFDPQDGQIFVGDVNIKDISKNDLMDMISYVFQSNQLFKTSIFENVRLGNTTASEEEVFAALKEAQCIDIIDKLPQGIHTQIGSQGTYLSGGEMQRIVIARAILKNSPILILDEATAFADPDNEVRIQNALSALSENKTVLMIAHRLTTVRNSDQIYVLKDGQICEHGTAEELEAKNGLFEKMWQDYQQSIAWKV